MGSNPLSWGLGGLIHDKFVKEPRERAKASASSAAMAQSEANVQKKLAEDERRRRRMLLLQPSMQTNLEQAVGRKTLGV